ncbi:MAG TPA: acetyl-CoA carboxylase carboxyltransferase subunit alpha [Clostridia bacterium]|nr:acetyl-CoA carboxylase carboxyltransferase subunit alpha [Clostridia bacterium]
MIVDKMKKRETSAKKTTSKVDIQVSKWLKCDKCKEILYKENVKNNLSICPNCGNYFRMSAKKRIELITDESTFLEFDLNIDNTNPLEMEDYVKKIAILREKTKVSEAVICGTGKINGLDSVICVMESKFLMGSMGSVVGEKITYSIEKAIELELPLIIVCVSGGARMQEGVISLMQMAKTTAALTKLHEKGLLYISLLTDPTYGGVTASFASLGDVILAEPGAMIGFAGPRVIEQTIGQSLPDGFQTSEFLLEQGFIDKIVERSNLKETLYKIIKFNKNSNEYKEKIIDSGKKRELNKVIESNKKTESVKKVELNNKIENKENITINNQNELTAWERVEIARSPKRKTALEYINTIFDEFIELHGDRSFKDDKAIVCGLAKIGNRNFTVIGEQKGRNVKENIERNFGMPNPESYRKAIRFMNQAEKFNRPVITFIDTKGAYPGLGAEERGQGEAIARSMFEMAKLKVPIIAIVIGEGSSGGALAIGVGNKVLMLENSIYSILSPEGYASILWKDSSRAKEAAEKMKLTAYDLLELEVIDKIITESSNIEDGFSKTCDQIKNEITQIIDDMSNLNKQEVVEQRYNKFRNIGKYQEISKR